MTRRGRLAAIGATVRRALGLRGRLAIALVLSSVATLIAAALIVLPTLSSRLVSDRLGDLRGLARTARPALLETPDPDVRENSPTLVRLVSRLERRTGGRIVVYDERGRALADTSPRSAPPAVGALDALRRSAATHRDDIATGRVGELLYAATDVRVTHDRLTLLLVKRLRDTRAAVNVVRAAFPRALGVGLAVALMLALMLSRGLLGRLRRLHADAVALGQDGLARGVDTSGHDEVGDVARALEAMRARLVDEEVSRQAFVATASHELRTPLASLQVTLELLREDVLTGRADPEHTAAQVGTALRQTHRLVGLAADLLDLSRVDGDVPLHVEPLEVAEPAGIVVREFEPNLAARGRSVELHGGPALAVADAGALVRIVRILLDNATNYGAGRVMVCVAGGADEVQVVVTDEGPGLDPGEQETVFVRFARGRAGREAPGAGLGLAIARGLARAMGGDLEARPVPVGACFALRLPAWHGDQVTPDRREARTPS